MALRPSMFLLHVPAILFVVGAILLGRWQLHAWEEHRHDRAAELAHVAPVPLADVLGHDDPFPASAVGRPVHFAATWLPEAPVYVADRSKSSDPRSPTGYWTVAFASTCGTGAMTCARPSALPVVVGWSQHIDRGRTAPTGRTTVTGWLQPAESADATDPHPGDDVLPALRTPDLLPRTSEDLYSGYLLLEEPAQARAGLSAVTPSSLPKAPAFTAVRNLFYALQWWMFGCFAVYLWWRWTRDQLAAPLPSEP
jgi:cytochrome oxidase assembly protein ShyY1